jgi:hypothetical protein
MARPLKHKELGYGYKFFGLFFHSNLPLAGIPLESNTLERWDVSLHLGVSPYAQGKNKTVSEERTYVSSDANDKGEPVLQIWRAKGGTFVRMAFEDGAQFWLDHQHQNIWATWPEYLPLELVTCDLLGPVVGLLLRLRGVICLHASAVSFGARSVAFLGSAGAGKSTTAAAFARAGYAVLADDIVALTEQDGAFYVVASHPQLCLWPESAKMLYGSEEALPRFNPAWDKRLLALGERGTRFENRALPLSGIYLLGDRRPDPAPYVEPMRSQAALLSLVADTYANKILDREMRAREFEALGRLISSVPVRRVVPHRDGTRLGELCRVIEKDFAALRDRTQTRS